MKKILASALAVAVAVGTADLLESAQARRFLVIGGGSEGGVYYFSGGQDHEPPSQLSARGKESTTC